jgi:hypothetical protein
MVGRNIGLSVRGISGQTDRYRAQRDRYKLFHPASALRQCKVLQATASCQQCGWVRRVKRVDAPYRSGPSKVWVKSKSQASDAVRREREEDWR